MKGLLLKDAYQMWSYTRWIILMSVAMMLMGTFFMKEGSNFFMLYGGLCCFVRKENTHAV